jgi:aryl-alcohol dehydrogenase-like predicted oxidoreductase
MKHITLGKSGLDVSRIAYGTWQLGGDWGPTDTAEAITAIREAAEAGVTFFDTAQAYGFGASEKMLGEALRVLRREDVVIATKGGLRPAGADQPHQADRGLVRDSTPTWIRKGVEASLEALGTDYIDLYQVHWPDPKTPFEDTAEALAKLVADGKVRHVGVSNFDAAQMDEFSRTLPVETLQPPYHLFRREAEDTVLPYTAQHDIGVLVYGPLAHGLLSGHLHRATRFAPQDWRSKSPMFRDEAYRVNLAVVDRLAEVAVELGISLPQLAIAWTLANPAVDVAIVGTRNSEHIHESIAAADIELDETALALIDDVARDAVPVPGPSPESV